MAISTLGDVNSLTKLFLSEPTNTTAGALATGGGSALDQATDVTLMELTNQAVADLCRRGGLAIDGQGTASGIASGTATVPLATLSVAGGATLWAAARTGVLYNGVPCQRITRAMAAVYGATASPGQYFFLAGQRALGLCGPSASSATLVVPGLVIPAPLAAGTDAITPFLEPDLRRLLAYWNAHYIAVRLIDDPTMEIRATPWGAKYEDGRVALLQRLAVEDPTTYATHYAGLLPTGKK